MTGRRHRLHGDVLARARPRGEWLSPGAHVNAVGSSVATARELDTAAVLRSRLFVDRREAALAEAGDFLIARRRAPSSDAHILGELGQLVIGEVRAARRRRTSRSSSRSASRSRTSRRPSTSTPRPAAPASASSSSSAEGATTPIEPIGRLEEIRAARRGSPARPSGRPCCGWPSTAPAEIFLKLECLQPIGSFKLRGAGNAMALASREALARGRLHGVGRQHGAGRGLERAAARNPVHGRRARTTPRRRKLVGDRAPRRRAS